jgi:DNA invertase Pin-like site-specific DNA recombinase
MWLNMTRIRSVFFRGINSLTPAERSSLHSAWRIVGEFARLPDHLRAARRKEFEVVIFWSFADLLAENPEAISSLAELICLGIEVFSLREPRITTHGVNGRTLAAFLQVFAKARKQGLARTIRKGQKRAERAGKTIGRPRRSVDRALIRRLAKRGESVRAIAAQAGTSKSTVQRIVRGASRDP